MAVTEAWTDIALLERDRLETAFSEAAILETAIPEIIDELNVGLVDSEFAEAGSHQGANVDWELQAACRAVPDAPALFFSEDLPDIVAAKAICAACPVIAPCLEGAIGRAEPCGVWGGQLFLNGRVLAQKRRRGRPPKVQRPEDQLPEVPIPAHLRELVAAAGR